MLFSVANNQYIEIISDPEAWQIADNDHAFMGDVRHDFKPTNSSRRLTALMEQITGICFCSFLR